MGHGRAPRAGVIRAHGDECGLDRATGGVHQRRAANWHLLKCVLPVRNVFVHNGTQLATCTRECGVAFERLVPSPLLVVVHHTGEVPRPPANELPARLARELRRQTRAAWTPARSTVYLDDQDRVVKVVEGQWEP